PYKIHTVLTDNGIQFTFPPRYADGPTAKYVTHMFGMRCQENGIEHRLTKIKHPWTNGQVERMNRTIKEATVQRYYYDRHDQLKAHLSDFINPYNYARRLKTLKGLTPYEYICKSWTSQPERFKLNPLQKMPGLNTYDAEDFVNELRSMKVTPHVAQNTSGRSSAIDGRTTRHAGYAVSQRIRKRIEEAFGWIMVVALQEKTKFRGRDRVGWAFTFVAAAYNLVRLPKLLALPG